MSDKETLFPVIENSPSYFKTAVSIIKPWWTRVKNWDSIGSRELSNEGIKMAFYQISLEDQKTFYASNWSGSSCLDVKALIKAYRDIPEATVISEYITNARDGAYSSVSIFWPTGFARLISFTDENEVEITIYGFDETKIRDLITLTDKLVVRKKALGRVYVMTATEKGIKLGSVGVAAVPFERGNYTDDVLNSVDYVVKEFKKEKPAGSIVLFDGEPGTGKSMMLRSLIGVLPNAMFVVIPSSAVASLANPEIIPVLRDTRDRHDGPIILVLEDCDEVLMPRQGDNISSLTTLLNMSDGILGDLLKLRIICTTNVKLEEVDAAVSRPGRMLKRIHVGRLDDKKANEIYQRLMKDTFAELPEKDGRWSLAEVYARAKDAEVPMEVTKARTVGFGVPQVELKDLVPEKNDILDFLDQPPSNKSSDTEGFISKEEQDLYEEWCRLEDAGNFEEADRRFEWIYDGDGGMTLKRKK